jgi:hypothetical protein
MQKTHNHHRPERLVLVGLADGSLLWFPNAEARRTHTTIRIRTEAGAEIVVPAAGTDLLTYEPRENWPWPTYLLEEAIDDLRLGIDEKLWRPIEERRREHSLPSEEAARRYGKRSRRS